MLSPGGPQDRVMTLRLQAVSKGSCGMNLAGKTESKRKVGASWHRNQPTMSSPPSSAITLPVIHCVLGVLRATIPAATSAGVVRR